MTEKRAIDWETLRNGFFTECEDCELFCDAPNCPLWAGLEVVGEEKHFGVPISEILNEKTQPPTARLGAPYDNWAKNLDREMEPVKALIEHPPAPDRDADGGTTPIPDCVCGHLWALHFHGGEDCTMCECSEYHRPKDGGKDGEE